MKQNQDNELFRDTLYFLLNPFIVTGLSTKKINKSVAVNKGINYSEALNLGYENTDIRNLFEYLKQNNTGRDLDVKVCNSYLVNFQPEMKEFIKSIITKSLKIGADAKTANRIFGSTFIPTFSCMLAEKYFEHPEKVEGKEFSITLKLDGIRCLAVKECGRVKFFSRQGQAIEGLVDIENELNSHFIDGYVLDGELLVTDTDSIPSKEQYKATTKIVRKDGEKHGVTYRVFDCMPLDQFQTQNCKSPYSKRRTELDKFFKDLTYTIHLPVLYSGSDTSMITKILDEVRADNQEGIMLNLNDAPYEFKRTKNLLKCKVMSDCDVLVTKLYEGTGKNIGKLGGIEVEFIHEGKYCRSNCGSGFTECERIKYYNNQELLIGKIVTIQYFEVSNNEKGECGLRFPVWINRIRNDKTEISMS